MNSIYKTVKSQGKAFVIVSVLVIVAMLASVLPLFTQPASAATCSNSKKYTVVAGDTLSSIAAKYNTTVAVLADLNDLKEPYVLSVGQSLCLPTTAKIITPTPKSTPASSSSKYKYDMKVTRDGKRITLSAASFPTKANYWVRVGQDLHHGEWARIGKLRTNKEGSGTGVYGLPSFLRNVPYYYLCVKNQMSDQVNCTKVYQPYTPNPNKRPTPTAKP